MSEEWQQGRHVDATEKESTHSTDTHHNCRPSVSIGLLVTGKDVHEKGTIHGHHSIDAEVNAVY
jgi:hypothetical protein